MRRNAEIIIIALINNNKFELTGLKKVSKQRVAKAP